MRLPAPAAPRSVVDDDAETVVLVEAREHVVQRRRAAVDRDLELVAAQRGGVHWAADLLKARRVYLS